MQEVTTSAAEVVIISTWWVEVVAYPMLLLAMLITGWILCMMARDLKKPSAVTWKLWLWIVAYRALNGKEN